MLLTATLKQQSMNCNSKCYLKGNKKDRELVSLVKGLVPNKNFTIIPD